MKKRNCRRTPVEIDQHERATKIRKMTDQQLCEYIDEIHAAENQSFVRKQAVEDFLSDVQNCCTGIGQKTIARLRGFAKGDGFIS